MDISKRITDLELALSAAINMLSVYEHGDSRCISDEFVSLCCVDGNFTTEPVREILKKASIMDMTEARKQNQELMNSLVTVTYGEYFDG